MAAVLFLNWLGLEILNYNSYARIKNSVSKKKKYSTDNIDSKWMENFWLEELSSEDLVEWIKNSMANPSGDPMDNLLGDPTNDPNEPILLQDIPRSTMLKWTVYNLYFKSLSQLDDHELENSRRVLSKIEDKIKFKFDGTKDMKFLKFGTKDIDSNYRPILIQPILKTIRKISYGVLKVEGFQKLRTTHGILYFYHKNSNPGANTVMFIHGLGFGITPYLSFIKNMKKDNNVITLVLPNISNMDFHAGYHHFEDQHLFPSYENWKEDIKQIIITHNVDKFDTIGHSFGTVIMGIMINDGWIEPKMDKKIFIDPVCFIDDSYKIYRYIDNPNHGTADSLVNDVFNVMIYRDIYVRYATQRFIYGPQFWIFDYDKLSSTKNLVILSNNDQMVPIDSVYKRLMKHNIPCIMVHGAYHAEIFTTTTYDSVLNSITHFVST